MNEVRKILREQLELLAERCKTVDSVDELSKLTHAMAALVQSSHSAVFLEEQQ